MSLLTRRFFATFALFGHACSRIASEFFVLAREAGGEGRIFDVIVYTNPLTPAEREAFEAVVLKVAGVSGGLPPRERLPVAAPRETSAFYFQVSSPSADAAAMRGLTLIRDATHQIGVTVERMHIEAEAA